MNTDVIVVGAGQAGCAAAFDLAAAGKKVLLLGKAGAKPCAGGVTIKAMRRLRFSIKALVRERPLQLDLSLKGWRQLRWPLEAPLCVLVERAELDAFCREQAIKQGVIYREVPRLGALRQDAEGVSLEVEGDTWRAPFLLAADGAHSPLRRLTVGGEKAAGAYAIEGKVLRAQANHYPGMRFDFQVAKGGYGWLFPKGDHINVGLYVSHLDGHLPDRDALKSYARKTLGTDAVENIQGFPLGTRMHELTATAGRILFVGDAMGATESLLGEGIYGAILTGQLAASALLDATNEGEVCARYRHSILEWQREIRLLQHIAWLFYHITPLAFGGLHHLLRSSLTQGYAAGLTPLQCTRLLRGAKVES